ncbi:MAG: DUF4139 domain-containing protein [Alphaproteobacteria bacterium]|nr:DUF4139 domain-containing protein [Alphaproteobacteria bacterium]
MKNNIKAVWVFIFFLINMSTHAEEIKLGVEQQKTLFLTIYNDDLALIKDQREIQFQSGINDLAFIDVSSLIKPETASLYALNDPTFSVIEQNFNFDLLTPQNLLQKSIGSKVKVIPPLSQPRTDKVEDAEILNVAEGNAILKIGNRIEIVTPERIIYSSLPPYLRPKPTLVLKVKTEKTNSGSIELSYLTRGFSWRADYVALLNQDENKLDLKGYVTLINQTDNVYQNAHIQLVAGTVNQVYEGGGAREKMDMVRQPMAMAAVAPLPASQSFFDYHIYTLDTPITLLQNQTKQVALLSVSNVKALKEYKFADLTQNYVLMKQADESEQIHPVVNLTMDNKKEAGLGLPLPKGIVRVYKNDEKGQGIFLGEDSIEHIPESSSVNVMLGQAFDVTAKPRQVSFEQIAKNIYESAYEIDIENAKKQKIFVTFIENFPGEWKIVQTNFQNDSKNTKQAKWIVPVEGQNKAKLTFKVRVKLPE